MELIEIVDGLQAFNELRHAPDLTPAVRAQIERLADALFRPSHRLIVYGSLAPGGANHPKLAALVGAWSAGFVEGDLRTSGWGTALGYSALRYRAGGPRVPAWLFVSPDLIAFWDELDRFEGPDYRRILVPIHLDGRLIAIGNLYEARAESRSAPSDP